MRTKSKWARSTGRGDGQRIWLLSMVWGYGLCGWPGPQVWGQDPTLRAAELPVEVVTRIETFCGDCHRLPNPRSFAQDRWHFEVKRGYEFYAKSGRQDLDLPTPEQTLTYYRQRAPALVEYPSSPEAPQLSPVQFLVEELTLGNGIGIIPEIADIQWAQLRAQGPPILLASDLRHGQVVAIDLARSNRQPPRVLAQLRNPGRMHVCDLDADGISEILVCDLGSYLPSDHRRSRLVMLHSLAEGEAYRELELLSGLGRISDVWVDDVDGDDQQDLIIAEFGWRDVGGLRLGKNISDETGWKFVLSTLDDRPGALSVRRVDFDADGRAELVVLYSQEYERIDLFRDDGRRYALRNLWQADDLTFGCSGMEIVDLNQDQLPDLLFTNGDAFDNSYISPWHGVQWLENQGELNFKYHRLTEMPGAYCARSADFNGDGLLDIAVVARLPPAPQPKNTPRFASVVLLLQAATGQFDRYTLEWDSAYYPCLSVGDFDADGDPDFAAASGPYVDELRKSKQEESYVKVWWNQAR